MAGITQEVHLKYIQMSPNHVQSGASLGLIFFTKLLESCCFLSMKGSVPRIGKNIFKKGVPKNCFCMFKTVFLLQISP